LLLLLALAPCALCCVLVCLIHPRRGRLSRVIGNRPDKIVESVTNVVYVFGPAADEDPLLNMNRDGRSQWMQCRWGHALRCVNHAGNLEQAVHKERTHIRAILAILASLFVRTWPCCCRRVDMVRG
jgi:hypothetical protein